MKMKYLTIIFLLLVSSVHSAHFRGSMISWRIVNSTSTSVYVELFQRHTWHYYTAICNSSQIAAGNLKIGSGNLVCWSPCPVNITNLASVAVPCTAFNLPENYTSGEGRVQIVLPMNKTVTGVFMGSAWFTLAQGGGNWSVAVQINTYRRSNGRFNQAPVVTMLPIIRLRRNLTYDIRINVADNDFDPYQCLWSTLFYECSGVCMSVPSTTLLNSSTCMLRFTPPKIGYYAVALTIVDYETKTSTTELSRVPIQFLFKIWDSNYTCSLPPLYLGDVPSDQCIYLEPGQALTMRIVIKIQCPNATLDNIIGVYPAGFTRSSIYLDPFDSTVNIFMINYTARVEQIGQNLFCFAGVDSIGNQGDTTCLRFTVQQGISSMNTLYLSNSTRYPTGTVSKSQSIWTLIYPNGTTYSRPTTQASIRFKYASSQVDAIVINVVTSSNVNYQSDRLIITTTTNFLPGLSYYISFDPGVFLEISTCLRDSMGITDATFWTFNIPSEVSSTSTTSPTTTTTETTTLRSRTQPSVRTIGSTSASLTTIATKRSTSDNVWTNPLSTTEHTPSVKKEFPVAGIVGILLGLIVLIVLIIKLRPLYPKVKQWCKKPDNRVRRLSVRHSITLIMNQYRVTTRMNRRKSRKYALDTVEENDESQNPIDTDQTNRRNSIVVKQNLVEIEC